MDLSAIITAHREGVLAGTALASLLAAVAQARAGGLQVEVVVLLDRPDDTTRAVFDDGAGAWTVTEASFGDQGLSRNRAVEVARGEHVAFLDADDLWSDNWLVEAHRLASVGEGRVICHPEVDWYFGSDNTLLVHPDQDDPGFDASLLRFTNYWDAMALAPRAAHLAHRYSARAVADGFAYEDWHWNCETLAAGYLHRVVPGTDHFKRRRPGSQTTEAARTRALPPFSRLHDHRWPGPPGPRRAAVEPG